MTKLTPEWVRTSDPVIRSPVRYRWTTAPGCVRGGRRGGRTHCSGDDGLDDTRQGVYRRDGTW